MSVQALSWVIEKSRQRGSNFVVLLMIANHAHSDGTNAYPSYERLAKESRLSARSVMRIVDALIASKELQTERGVGPHGTNVYSLPLIPVESTDIDGVSNLTYDKPGPKPVPHLGPKCHPNRKEPNKPPVSSPSKPSPTKFLPPTEGEVHAYMVEQQLENPADEAKAFIAHHETRGWIPSGQRTQMKSWQAAVRTWKHFQRKGGPRNGFKNRTADGVEYTKKNLKAFVERHSEVAGDLFREPPPAGGSDAT
jgi:hypothetical protein